MKMFDGMQSFFNSLGEYIKDYSTLFLIFLGAFLLVSVVIIIITSFAYECKLTKTVDKINKFLERNPRINDDNLVAFNNMMKERSVPKTLRRQWQQFMLYREHPASYYMSFQHCVENPMRNSTYRQQMTVYRVISFVLAIIGFVISAFMSVDQGYVNRFLMDVSIIPISILVLYWLISMVLDLIHSAVSGDLFQNYQYFEINMDKAMLTLPEFVDYEVLFSQDEIKRGIPVLFAYLQKRAIQEQQELEKARLKSVDHEKFDFDKAGLDGSLVLDRAMRETENYTTQRKKYMQEIERVNNEIGTLENNYREKTKDFQRQVQTSKETVENLKEQLEQASSTIEINYIKKQMRDEINRQQEGEKEFDILTDKHNQEIKSLNQEIKNYEDEIKKAKEAMEVAMLSEFNTYSVKVYDNLEKIVDDKMQDRVDEYKEQIKGLEIELEEKNEELESVYTRYQEVLSQIPLESETVPEEVAPEMPIKKSKKKKKSFDEPPADDYIQPDPVQYDEMLDQQYYDQQGEGQMYDEYSDPNAEYAQDYSYDDGQYNEQYVDNYNAYDNQNVDNYSDFNGEYVPLDSQNTGEYASESEYVPADNNYETYGEEYVPLDQSEYIPQSEEQAIYAPMDEDFTYVPLEQEQSDYVSSNQQNEYIPLDQEKSVSLDEATEESIGNDEKLFDDSDFDIDFGKLEAKSEKFDDMDFDFDFAENDKESKKAEVEEIKEEVEEEIEEDFDLNKLLGLYDESEDEKPSTEEKEVEEASQTEPKRKAGRPRKVVDETEVAPKRKVGRPRKVVDQVEEDKPKRKAGRPRKVVDETEVAPKRKAGRPRKTEEVEVKTEVKRKAGRPRKVLEEVSTEPKRKAGRPRKEVNETVVTPKRKAGRPRKTEEVEVKTEVKRKAGRPRKDQSTAKKAVNGQGVLTAPKRKAGRPRKS